MYRFYIDGKDVSSFLFMPGWTDYSKRLQVQTFDVTPFLTGKKGSAQLSALLGNGWAAAKLLAWQERPYAPFPSFIAEMTVLYRDGTKEIFGTDESWEVWTSGILSSEIYLFVYADISEALETEDGFEVVLSAAERIGAYGACVSVVFVVKISVFVEDLRGDKGNFRAARPFAPHADVSCETR